MIICNYSGTLKSYNRLNNYKMQFYRKGCKGNHKGRKELIINQLLLLRL